MFRQVETVRGNLVLKRMRIKKKRRKEREGGPVGTQMSGVQLILYDTDNCSLYSLYFYIMESVLLM